MMKKLLSFAVVAVAMMSCQKNDVTVADESNEIKLTAGVLEMVSETKAPITGTAFAENTVIGLYGLSDGQTDWTAPFFNNTGATIAANGSVEFTDKVYYPQDNKAVDFYAFYPKGTPVATASAATVAYDLTAQDDILWATVKTGTLSNKKANALVFTHKLAKVNFKVKAGTGFVTGLTVTSVLVTANTAATLDVKTGALTFATPGNITAFTGAEAIATTETATAFGDVMIQPGAAYTIKMTVAGVDYTADLTAPAEGKAKTVTLTFLPTGVDVTTSITGWDTETGDSADMEIK